MLAFAKDVLSGHKRFFLADIGDLAKLIARPGL